MRLHLKWNMFITHRDFSYTGSFWSSCWNYIFNILQCFQIFKNKGSKLLYYGIILFIIWAYAFITGNSPSVLRATFMITVVLIAEILSRKSNIYNSILVSAFALLLVNSNLLYSVSFQLSYAAVFGIFYL